MVSIINFLLYKMNTSTILFSLHTTTMTTKIHKTNIKQSTFSILWFLVWQQTQPETRKRLKNAPFKIAFLIRIIIKRGFENGSNANVQRPSGCNKVHVYYAVVLTAPCTRLTLTRGSNASRLTLWRGKNRRLILKFVALICV